MHGALIGLDITRKLTVPANARLPAAPPAPGAAAADACPAVLEDSAAIGADGCLIGMDIDAAAGAENTERVLADACNAARPPDQAAEQWRPAQGNAAPEQHASCLEASEPECLSADTSHHAQLVPEQGRQGWDMAVNNAEQTTPQAQQEASSCLAAARRLPPLRQTKLLMPSPLPGTAAAPTHSSAELGARQQVSSACKQGQPANSSAASKGSGIQKKAGQKARSKAAKISAGPAMFDGFRYDPSSQQPGAAAPSKFFPTQALHARESQQ
jgi:hypothetical protein